MNHNLVDLLDINVLEHSCYEWKFTVLPQDFYYEELLNQNIFKPHIKYHFLPKPFNRPSLNITPEAIVTCNLPSVAPSSIVSKKTQFNMAIPLSPPQSPEIPNDNRISKRTKNYKCEHCPSTFSRNHDLKRHTRIHLGLKPFKCVDCDMAFTRLDALNRHNYVGCKQRVPQSQPNQMLQVN
ncbi:hypothetical protein BC833DRAFT_600648 [Globomyces pollinis-pini]|nr:hypothetical protein BC833DRAFT_600648 [Globomyces pollinis-pini]